MIDWLTPQTVEVVKSKFNGVIKVTKYRGNYSVWVGGFEQSGPIYVEKLWRSALNNITIQQSNNILILGLGCGTLAPLIFKKWPEAKIVGVEIDPTMINLGKKYFNLSGYKNLKIIQGDAKKQKLTGYDLIICDAYLGGKNQFSKLKSKVPVLSNVLNPRTLKNKIVLTTFARGPLANLQANLQTTNYSAPKTVSRPR